MQGRIQGSWPGGPKRDGESEERTRAPRLRRVEDIEARIADRSLRIKRTSRTKRMVLGLAFVVLLAGGFGWILGLSSHTSLAQINSVQSQRQQQDATVSTEVNRMMMQLWRMEDVEYSRNRSGR